MDNLPLRKGIVLTIGTLVWFWGWVKWFRVSAPYGAWFDALHPADKAYAGGFALVGLFIAFDAIFLLWYGIRHPPGSGRGGVDPRIGNRRSGGGRRSGDLR